MLLSLPGMLMICIGIAKVYSDMVMAAITIGLGLGIIICVKILDEKYLNSREKKYFQKVAEEIQNLKKIGSWPAEKVLKTSTKQFPGVFLFSLFIVLIVSILIYNEMTSTLVNWEVILVSVCVLAIAVLCFLNSIPYLGKPVCELSRAGFSTPRWGFIPWHQVFGIGLSFYLDRFDLRRYTLYFHVENSQSILEKRWIHRMLVYLGLVRAQAKYFNIAIVLNSSSKYETPETIEAAAKLLWNKATGRQYDWKPWFSDAYNDAVRRISENSINMDVQENDSMHDWEQKFEENLRDLKIIENELCRHVSRINWLARLSIFGMLATLLWLFLKVISL